MHNRPALGIALVAAGLIAMPGCGRDAEASEPAQASAPTADSPAVAPADYDPRQSLAPMIRAVGPSVVAIYTGGRGTVRGSGSGFIVSEQGLVVTNHHVIEDAVEVEVRLSDGRQLAAEVLGSDKATDLALLNLRDASDLPTAALGDSAALEVGDWVVAIGNPMGLEHSASVGIISGKGRGSLGLYRDSYLDFLQTDADIAPGSSGGPLFDFQGRVVGITTAVGAGSRPGFAIPVDTVERVVAQLSKHGRVARGWLGAASVSGQRSDDAATIGKVYEGTPAHAAGLQPGDRVVKIDGDPIHSFRELRSRVATTEPGKTLGLTVERGDDTVQLSVELQERPEGDALRALREATAAPATPAPDAAPEPHSRLPFGITLPSPSADGTEPTPPSPGPRLGVQARTGDDGVEIVTVEPDSLADELGLTEGDRITEINDVKIREAGDVAPALAKDERNVTLRFERNGAPHRVTLERH